MLWQKEYMFVLQQTLTLYRLYAKKNSD